MWDLRVGRYLFDEQDDPSTGDRTTPNHRDHVTGISSGNVREMGGLKLDRITAKAVFNRYQAAWLGANHEFKAGIQIERGEHRSPTVIPGGVRYIDNNGAPFQAEYRDPSIAGGRADIFALFASDAITLNDRVTVNAGIRFDHSRASSQDVPGLDASGAETDETIAGLGTLYTWNVVSPRLGVTAKLTADGRTMLRASYGRFNQGVLTGELSPVHPGVTPTTTMAFDAATGGYTQLVSVIDPKLNLALDPQTRTPRTDEYSVGVERQLSARLTASAAYIRKTGANFIAWTDTAGVYGEEPRTVGGYSVPVFVLTNATERSPFPSDEPRRLLDGLPRDGGRDGQATVERVAGVRLIHVLACRRTAGVERRDGRRRTDEHRGAGEPVRQRSQQPHERGRPAAQRSPARPPYDRQSSTCRGSGFWSAANLQHFSGKPWAATAQVSLASGRPAHPARRARLPAAVVAIHRSISACRRMLRFGEATRVELLLDVLNLFASPTGGSREGLGVAGAIIAGCGPR